MSVDRRDDRLELRPVGLQRVEPLERIRRRQLPGAADDLPGHRVHRRFVSREEVRDRGIAFGDPGAFVKQIGGGVEIRKRDFDQAAAELRQGLQRRVEAVRHRRVAEEFEVAFGGNADSEHRRALAEQRDFDGLRIGIAGILPGGDLEHAIGVLDGERKDGNAVERTAGRHDAAGRERADRRLQPDDIVQPRRDAARARRVGAERERNDTARRRHRRTGRRAARHQEGSTAFRGMG